MLLLIGPSSTTCAPVLAINRPSEVPPLVCGEVSSDVTVRIALVVASISSGDSVINGEYIFDSRPPKMPSNILLQHFQGYLVNSEDEIFDEKTVILMDFRCDQSRGMHFIYLLPFSKNTAFVESTIFSKQVEPNDFYAKEIFKYLKKYYNLKTFTKSNHEKGIIPMHDVSLKSNGIHNIGTRGGAVRPSSGYAFTFIQKQVLQILVLIMILKT